MADDDVPLGPGEDGGMDGAPPPGDKSNDDIKINRYATGPPRGRGFGPRGPRYINRVVKIVLNIKLATCPPYTLGINNA